MKRRSLLLAGIGLTLISSIAAAGINAVNGFYLGGEFGAAYNQRADGASWVDTFADTSLYVRPFIGYRVSDFVAVEGGYALIRDRSSAGDQTYGPDHYKLSIIDIAGKVIYPFTNGFSIYAKGGLAYTHQDVYNKTFASDPAPLIDSNTTKILPLIGAGFSYNFTSKLAMDFSGAHIHGSGVIHDINLLGISVSYNFG